MKIENIIRRLLKEETNPLLSALRRVSFTEENVEYFLKKFSLRFLTKDKNIDLLIYKVCNFTSYELIEPGTLHMSDEDADMAVKELSKKLTNKYSVFIKNYVDNIIDSDDNETYCFIKHSDRYMDMLKNTGFGDCRKGWSNFMSEYGSWFPDLDWDEIKEKISSEPNKNLLIKKPLEGHNFKYYFSVKKIMR